MNISRDGISSNTVNSYALQATIAIVMITAPVSFVCGLILSPFASDNYILRIVISIGAGLSLTSYFFLKKLIGASMYEAAKRGITEELNESFRKHDK